MPFGPWRHARYRQVLLSRLFPPDVAARRDVRRAGTGRERAQRPAHAPSQTGPIEAICWTILTPLDATAVEWIHWMPGGMKQWT